MTKTGQVVLDRVRVTETRNVRAETMQELSGKHIVLIIENEAVPFDRRMWNMALSLREFGADVTVMDRQAPAFGGVRYLACDLATPHGSDAAAWKARRSAAVMPAWSGGTSTRMRIRSRLNSAAVFCSPTGFIDERTMTALGSFVRFGARTCKRGG